ncbi:hypothetical protein CBR_g39055 [Chara braunii]|uniref:GIY-YIG domain-containing protein n=1 Tax=Chara braunii TaxID=69332 RepID=A0A388LQR4_CHABU|nr:hypothetical protein CBR_g39055 [Chara braunii]|eukprot:GBG84680.1 hypothetical protein CBR_g39055 [Chara braunii]
MTERDLWARWREHFCQAKKGGCKRRRRLYNWLSKVGAHKYVATPIFTSNSKSELAAVERTLIKRWSPSLNSTSGKNKKGEKKKRKRFGKKERSKNRRGGMRSAEGSDRKSGGKIVAIGEARVNGKTVKIVEFLRAGIKNKEKGDMVVVSDGGDTWSDGWRVVRRLFGETKVKIGRGTRPLKKCKRLFDKKGELTLKRITEASPTTLRLRNHMIAMFKNKCRQTDLLKKNLKELLKYYSAIKTFTTKRSKSRARSMLSRAIKEVSGMSVCKSVIAKIEFDDIIRKSEVTRLVRKKTEGLQLAKPMREMVKRRAWMVGTRCPNVGDLILNHRRFSSLRASSCTCAGLPYPKRDGHVHFRIGELDRVLAIVKNAKNVPRNEGERREARLKSEFENAFQTWEIELGKPCGEVIVNMSEVDKCFDGRKSEEQVGNLGEVMMVKLRLQGLVLAPLDRNPSETLVLCPCLYARGMDETFFQIDGYRFRERSEEELATAHAKFVRKNLGVHGKWDAGERIGSAYMLYPSIRTRRGSGQYVQHMANPR